jgi:Lar family restriction alleviation protein
MDIEELRANMTALKMSYQETQQIASTKKMRAWYAGAAKACETILGYLPVPLLPCPFCGQQPGHDEEMGDDWIVVIGDHEVRFVTCHQCHTDGPHGISDKAAITRWNTRV